MVAHNAAMEARPSDDLGLYLHVPFCARKCPYCDFNTYAGLESRFGSYVDALCREIALRRAAEPAAVDRVVTSVFLGGGTPTVLSTAQLAQILGAVRDHLTLAADVEITSEANPGTVDAERFAGLRAIGVNRLSLGAQSLRRGELAFLGRIHGAAEVGAAVRAARAAGFDNMNLDFLFGLPGQSARAWRETLARALDLGTDHLSLYSLIVEPETPLQRWVTSGAVAAPDDDAAARRYQTAMRVLATAGFGHYEVSNWSRSPAHRSRHNLLYWRNGEYLAFGAGAHGHLRTRDAHGRLHDVRWSNDRPVDAYIARVQAGELPVAFREEVSPAAAMGETMMVGLRLVDEGVAHARFADLHGDDPREVYAAVLAELRDWGLVDVDAHRTRLTRRGLMVGNQVFGRFAADV